MSVFNIGELYANTFGGSIDEPKIMPITEEINAIQVTEEPKPRLRYLNGFTRDMFKGQDVVAFGAEEDYDWGIVLDGHGDNGQRGFIKIIKQYNWREIMITEDPCTTLLSMLKMEYRYTTGGSTMLMMKAYADHIDTVSIGDSLIVIYKNGRIAYKSCPHNEKNLADMERVIADGGILIPGKQDISYLASASKMRTHRPGYIRFRSGGVMIAPTQALGHGGITGYNPEKNTLHFGPNDHIRCMLFTDGHGDMTLFESEVVEDLEKDQTDMLTMTVSQLVDKTEARWKQEWNLEYCQKPVRSTLISYPDDMWDDIGLLVWDNRNPV